MKKVNGFYPDLINVIPKMSDDELQAHLCWAMAVARSLNGKKKNLIIRWYMKICCPKIWNLWKDHLSFLIKRYIREMVEELYFRNSKIGKRYMKEYVKLFNKEIKDVKIKTPDWLIPDYINTHSKVLVERLEDEE